MRAVDWVVSCCSQVLAEAAAHVLPSPSPPLYAPDLVPSLLHVPGGCRACRHVLKVVWEKYGWARRIGICSTDEQGRVQDGGSTVTSACFSTADYACCIGRVLERAFLRSSPVQFVVTTKECKASNGGQW
jgi:hypothetical protein